MKINTQKMLLLLFSDENLAVNYTHLGYLWPELSPSGRRSLVSLLVKKRIIEPTLDMEDPNKAYFHLTEFGKREAARIYGGILGTSLSETPYCLLLLEAPDHDPNFLLLKKRIAQFGAIPANSKAYLFLSKPTEELLSLLEKKYFYQTAVFQIGEWRGGDLKQLIQKNSASKDALYSLSGISRQVGELIHMEIPYFIANHQSYFDIFSAYDRFFSLLLPFRFLPSPDPGLSLSSKDLLSRFQKILPRG
jgi:hypothetical protein